METFNEKAEELMEKLEEKADGKKEFSMLTMMSRVTLDVIAKVPAVCFLASQEGMEVAGSGAGARETDLYPEMPKELRQQLRDFHSDWDIGRSS